MNVAPETRDGIAKGLIQSGFSPSDAHEVADLACHAIDSAVETLHSVTKRASSPGNFVQAHVISLQLARDHFGKLSEASVEAVSSLAQALGIDVAKIKVRS